MPTSRTIGKPESFGAQKSYFPNFITGFRTGVGADDSAPYETDYLHGSNSRNGTGVLAFIDVIASASGVVVELWVKEGADFIFVASQTTTMPKQQLTFSNLIARDYYIRLTSAVGKAVSINAGISQ